MPLPVLIGMAALAGAGAVAGGSGMRKLRRAKSTVAERQVALDQAERLVHDQRVACEAAFRLLGGTKLATMEEALVPFHAAFQRLKNVELHVDTPEEGAPAIDQVCVVEAGRVTLSVLDTLSGLGLAGAASLGASAGTTAAVGAFATASTGTTISSLSGAAATNATLAWLGGGSLATGGGGVAAGTTVMAGVVAAPVMLVGGVFLHQKGRKSLANAEQFAADADAAAAKQREAAAILKAATGHATETRELLELLEPRLARRTGWLEAVTAARADWNEFDRHEQERIRELVVLAMATSRLVHTPVVDEEGSLTRAIRKACDDGRVIAGTA